eukprot:CAMPEP_0179715158 /NCGR_PEP_ID=MMETSP0938-20121108/1206_1 /TAXON_ID=548131 ORGANISM="Ostreococcus mediterraneus, Strain clade-D-RCC1107" /NCGR_SAMPLE_ID=MMETSP0938 /ASSEMBLY_ACC=CAM_ASM_000576 /LENGTH=136 /DNA_ID=CAMNT_0021588835 /DNA_START=344 /DNA_END=754 /DNA_ORIENTATION=-
MRCELRVAILFELLRDWREIHDEGVLLFALVPAFVVTLAPELPFHARVGVWKHVVPIERAYDVTVICDRLIERITINHSRQNCGYGDIRHVRPRIGVCARVHGDEVLVAVVDYDNRIRPSELCVPHFHRKRATTAI